MPEPRPPISLMGRQAQLQQELQAQGQAQAELQAQLQGQGQDQGQGQMQGQYSWSDNYNGNMNGNLNANANANLNANANVSETTTSVAVKVKLDLEGYMPKDNDLFDLDHAVTGDIFYAKDDINYDPGNEVELQDILGCALTGQGNDVGQVWAQSNNLYDSDSLQSARVESHGGFGTVAAVTGGIAGTGDGIAEAGSEPAGGGGIEVPGLGELGLGGGGLSADLGALGSGNGDDGYVAGHAEAGAGASFELTAFNQSIVQGANVLGNTIDTTVVGGPMTTTYSIGDDDMA